MQWDPVANATGYEVYYDTQSRRYTLTKDAGNQTGEPDRLRLSRRIPPDSGHAGHRGGMADHSHEPTFSGNVTHAFSSRLISLRKRQSVPSAMILFGVNWIMPTSCRRSA